MPEHDERAMLTQNDIAAHFKVHPKTVAVWVKDGKFPSPVKIGRRLVRWPASVLDKKESPEVPSK